MAISFYLSETLMICLNHIPNLKILSESILKLSLFYTYFCSVLFQWLHSLTHAVMSQAENSDLLKRMLIE